MLERIINKRHRIISLFLALLMMVSLIPILETNVFAEDEINQWHKYGECQWRIDDKGTLTVKPINGVYGELKRSDENEVFPNFSDERAKKVKFEGKVIIDTCGGLFSECNNLEEIDLKGLDTSKVKDMSRMFRKCGNLKKINLQGLDTSNVTDMSNMFAYCVSLKEIDLTSLDTSNVTSMAYMFHNCSITEFNSTGLKTSKVTNMGSMFWECRALKSIDLTNLDTSKVTNMQNMFYRCYSLNSIDISSLDTSNVTNMSSMFHGCISLKEIDLTNLDTSKVTDMSYTFADCDSLKEIDLTNLDTSKVTNMSFMFAFCVSLKEIDLTNLDTSKVTDMSHMFDCCSSLKEIDLTKLNTSNVTNVDWMFRDCTNLKTLDLSELDFSKVFQYYHMFENSLNLKTVSFPKYFLERYTGYLDGSLSKDIGLLERKWQEVGSGTETKPNGKIFVSTDEMLKYHKKNGTGKETYVDYDQINQELNPNPNPGIDPGDTPDEEGPLNTDGKVEQIKFQNHTINFNWNVDDIIDKSNMYNRNLAIGSLYLSDAIENWNVEKAMRKLKLLGSENNKENYEISTYLPAGYENASDGVARTTSLIRYYKNGKAYNIITIVIRGTKDAEDWIINVSFGGFYNQANQIMKETDNFLKSHGIEDGIKNKENRFLVTGHSLGGAVANITADELILNGCKKNQVKTYTFAAPKTAKHKEASEKSRENIWNFSNTEDDVTYLPTSFNTTKYGNTFFIDPFRNSARKNLFFETYMKITSEKYFPFIFQGPHSTATYMSIVLNLEEFQKLDHFDIQSIPKIFRHIIQCPVNITVRDKDGNMVASIVNNKVEFEKEGVAECLVYDGDKKMIKLNGDSYTFELTGTDEGILSYWIETFEIDDTAKLVPVRKEFNNIKLTNGKQMISKTGGDINLKNISLHVTNENGKPIANINPDGSEESIPLTNNSRLAGANRYETSIKVAQDLKKTMNVDKFDAAVVAYGDNYADALSGAYLAKINNAPLLLINENNMQGAIDFIRNNVKAGKSSKIYLLGGKTVMPESMRTKLEDSYTVKRLAGDDRFATNLAILEEAKVSNEELVISSGYGFADSLAASASGKPILLVGDAITNNQLVFLAGVKSKKYTIAGGVKSVNTSIERKLQSMGNVKRVFGEDRYKTSVEIAKHFFKNPGKVVIGYGDNFPDGLCGGVLADRLGAPLLLINESNSESAKQYVKDNSIKHQIILGGKTMISDNIVNAIAG